MELLGSIGWFTVAGAAITVVALIALPVAMVIALAVSAAFQRSVSRSMQVTSLRSGADARADSAQSNAPERQGRADTGADLQVIERSIEDLPRDLTPGLAIGRLRRRTYILAVLLQVAMGTGVVTLTGQLAPRGMMTFALAFAMAVPIAVAVATTGRTRAVALAAVAYLAVLACVDAVFGTRVLATCLYTTAIPAASVLLLQARRWRAVGLLVYACVTLVVSGWLAGSLLGATFVLDAVGPVRLADPALAGLSPVDAVLHWFTERSQGGDDLLTAVAAFARDLHGAFDVAHPEALDARVRLLFHAAWIGGIVLSALAAWAFLTWIATQYRNRRASDHMLQADAVLAIFTVWETIILLAAYPRAAAFAVLGFPVYVVGLRVLLGRWPHGPAPFEPLLLLRVFGFERRTQRLLDDLAFKWRVRGPIRLIAGADVATATLEPHEFLDFLSGRLSRAFIAGPDDLARRLEQASAVPDPDGLYRIEDYFCHADAWQRTVERLADTAAVAVMDLRGFGVRNAGCVFELGHLVRTVPLDRLVLLVDTAADRGLIASTARAAWRAGPTSAVAQPPTLNLVRVDRPGYAVARLMPILMQAARAS